MPVALTTEELDTEGVLQWDPDNEVRGEFDGGDTFEPSFELDTTEHAQWVAATKAA